MVGRHCCWASSIALKSSGMQYEQRLFFGIRMGDQVGARTGNPLKGTTVVYVFEGVTACGQAFRTQAG